MNAPSPLRHYLNPYSFGDVSAKLDETSIVERKEVVDSDSCLLNIGREYQACCTH